MSGTSLKSFPGVQDGHRTRATNQVPGLAPHSIGIKETEYRACIRVRHVSWLRHYPFLMCMLLGGR